MVEMLMVVVVMVAVVVMLVSVFQRSSMGDTRKFE